MTMAMVIASAYPETLTFKRFVVQTANYFLVLNMFHLMYLGYRAEKPRGLGPL